MSCDQSYPLPQVFLVEGGGGPHHPMQPPNLVPCWSFPPAQERTRSRGKSRGCMGISPGVAMLVLLLFLLVFAALGFEAYQILDMQKRIKSIEKAEAVTEPSAPLKQIGFPDLKPNGNDMSSRPAAHVIGRIETSDFRKTLRWDSKIGQAFTSGGVAYRTEDGGLQVNETGLYHVYSRVELIFKDCSATSFFEHTVFVRRGGSPPLSLMTAHRAGFCPPRPTHSWTTESYLGSALQLKKNDRVFVNVSHPIYLSHEHHANFFGLYKI